MGHTAKRTITGELANGISDGISTMTGALKHSRSQRKQRGIRLTQAAGFNTRETHSGWGYAKRRSLLA